jgi:hypothetical protein
MLARDNRAPYPEAPGSSVARAAIHCQFLGATAVSGDNDNLDRMAQTGSMGGRSPLSTDAPALESPGPFAGHSAGAPPAEPAIPERIGKYRVLRRLGGGGFGDVYRGRDEELKRDVAIKVPRPEFKNRPELAQLYLAEARAAAALLHPNIVPVYDSGRDDQFAFYMVTRYIDGNSLAECMRQGRLPPPQAARIVATVADALHEAHKHRLVHRDIKPQNILLDRQGMPHVADFGLALREDAHDQHAGGCTLEYMSPEQARGEGHRVDGRSDVFSLGVVFY